jgi:hypothetical protein
VATNAPSANAIATFVRLADGSLAGSQGTFVTGGAGTGGPLGNQGGLLMSKELADVVPSGGMQPISLTLHDDLLFVLHFGGLVGSHDSITGSGWTADGMLEPIQGSARPLSAASTDPAQIGFSHDGSVLVVTEDDQQDHDLRRRLQRPSRRSEPAGLCRNRAALSRWSNPRSRRPRRRPAGWCSPTGFDGNLALLDADSETPATGAGPIDMATSNDGRFLYALNAGDGPISIFEVDTQDGSLQAQGSAGSLPRGSNGLAAR